MIFFQLFIQVCCGALNAWGGYSWHNARRFLMPSLLCVSICIILHSWWLGVLVLPAMGTLCLGYGKDGNFGRALWIGMQCVALGLGLVLFQHLLWWLFLPYVLLGCVLGGLYKNWQQVIGDVITGCYMGLIVFLVH